MNRYGHGLLWFARVLVLAVSLCGVLAWVENAVTVLHPMSNDMTMTVCAVGIPCGS